jgi:S-methylmethionine-dependent homocysteine/selenocysteine methylase
MITLMDGGMGDELTKRGSGSGTGLWSARALLVAPQEVKAVHRDFIRAGARMITTNSYSTIPSYLGKEGLADRFEELANLAGKLAREAAEESGENVKVMGSLPPMSESYRADLVPPEELSRPIYEALTKALEPYVDGFICETLSTAGEARVAASVACEAVKGSGRKVILSWTLDEEPGKGLRSGETIDEAFDLIKDLPIDALMFNCTHPVAVEAGLKELRALTNLPIGGYANTMNVVPKGWTLDAGTVGRREDRSPALYAEAAIRWIDVGATMIGGCCGVGPDHIKAISERLAGLKA